MILTQQKNLKLDDNTAITIYEYYKCLYSAHICFDQYYFISQLYTTEAEAIAEVVNILNEVMCVL